MTDPTSSDRDLGLDQPITRRDFLDASLLAAGAGLLKMPAPLGQAPSAAQAWEGFAGVGDYARSHGNMWSTIDTAHQLRDRKIGGPDAAKGAIDSGERYDLIVVGGGISGLGAAAFFQKLKGGRVLVLDNHPMPGGEAKRNEFLVDGTRLIGPQGSKDFGTRLPGGWAGDYWKELGLPHGVGSLEHQPGQLLLPALGRRVRESRIFLQATGWVPPVGAGCLSRRAQGCPVARSAAKRLHPVAVQSESVRRDRPPALA